MRAHAVTADLEYARVIGSRDAAATAAIRARMRGLKTSDFREISSEKAGFCAAGICAGECSYLPPEKAGSVAFAEYVAALKGKK